MDCAYSTRPLTSDEMALARLWTQRRVYIAGLQLLVMRMEQPQLTLEQLLNETHPQEVGGYLFGLLKSIERDVQLTIATGKFDRLIPQNARRH